MELGIEPATFRLLLKPQKVEEKTPGGIVLPESAREAEQTAVNVGKIVALGESCGYYFRQNYEAEWPFKLGDMVLYKRHHGAKVTDPSTGEKYILLNDEHIEARYKEGVVKEEVSINERY